MIHAILDEYSHARSDTHVLEKDRLIRGLGKPRLGPALGLFQALLQTGARNAIVAVLNSLFKLCLLYTSF